MKKLLSICGGGVRGIQPSVYIEALEHISGKSAASQFDLITGTSTGGIIALAMTVGLLDGTELVQLYHKDGPKIFARPWYRPVTTVGGVLGPKYDNTGLLAVMRKHLENKALGSARKPTMIPTYSLEARAAYFFKSWDSADCADCAWLPAVATASAPTYFPAFNGYVDGGLAANDPTLCGVVELMKLHNCAPKDVAVLTLGTGQSDKPINETSWGFGGWATQIVDCLMDGSQATVDYQCSQLGLGAYLRLDAPLGANPDAPMDDASPAPLHALEASARKVVMHQTQALLEWLDRSSK